MSLEQRGVFYFEPSDDISPELLQVFQYGMWKDQSAEFLSQLSVPLKRKLRQLSLISMAMYAKALEYSYLEKQLDLDGSEIELFLVEALLDRAVDGRVNGADQTLHIYSCATRNMDPQQVSNASEMLNSFMDRLESTIYDNMARLKSGDKGAEETGSGTGAQASAETVETAEPADISTPLPEAVDSPQPPSQADEDTASSEERSLKRTHEDSR